MANRTVVVDLIVNTAKWTAGFQKAAHDMTSATTNAETKTRALQQQVGLLGVGMTSFAALAVRSWAMFDQAMSRVEATGGEAAARIGDLTEAAKSDTVTQLGYSATEAAASIYELTKAGVNADAILSGALNGALSLAAAESMDAAEAASIMASALGQFSLEGEQSAHVADLITAAAGKAQGSAHDLGFALKQSGLVANQFGLSIEETTGTLGLFANAGLIGSDAGTSLRTMLLHLVGPSGKSAELMKELGFSAYDASGQFKSMEQLTNDLGVALGAKSEQERNAAFATIFGADATRAASLLYREGGDAVAEWTAKVNDAGYAQEVARKRMDNLNGDLKILSSSWEKALIEMGASADAPLRGLVQAATGVISAFADAPPAVQGLTLALAGGGGLGILGVLAISQVFNALDTLKAGLVSTGIVGEATGTKIANGMKVATVGAGIALAAIAVGLSIIATRAAESSARVDALAQTWSEAGQATQATTDLITSSLTKQTDNLVDGNKTLIELADQVGVSTSDLIGYIEGEGDAIERVNGQIAAHSDITGEWIGQALTEQTQAQNLKKELGDLGDEYVRSKEMSELNAEAIAAGGEAAEGATEATSDTTSAIQDQSEAIQDNIDAWNELANIHMSADEALANYEQSIDDAAEAIHAAQTDTEKYSELLGDNRDALDLNTQAGRDAQDALLGISKAAHEQMQASYDAGVGTEELTKQMGSARTQFIKAATAAGLNKEAAEALADSYGLIPENVQTTIDADDQASAVIQDVKNGLNGLFDKTVKITTIRQVLGPDAPSPLLRASGGPIVGGEAGKDSVPVLAMPGEHMLTTKDVQAMGGQQAVYAWRQGLHSGSAGMMRMASGGAIGSVEREIAQQLRFHKQVSKIAHGDVSKATKKRAEERLSDIEGTLAELRASLESLKQEKTQSTRDIRRGDFRDSVTSGLSGAQSTADSLYDLAFSGDMTKSQSKALKESAWQAEKAFTTLYNRAASIETKLADARDRLSELQQISDQVSSGLAGEQSLSNAFVTTTNPWSGAESTSVTGQGMLAGAQAKLGKLRSFASKLKELADLGLSGPILQEIAGMGTEAGLQAADALLADKSVIKPLNQAYASIDFAAGEAGQAVTEGFYKGGVSAAEGLVKGLESQEKAVEAAILKIAKGMESALKKALGIKSPSTLFAGLMTYVGDGAVIGLERQAPRVSAAAAALVDVAGRYVNGMGYGANTAGSYPVGAASSTVMKNINIQIHSNNAVAEKDSVMVNKALQSAAAIGE